MAFPPKKKALPKQPHQPEPTRGSNGRPDRRKASGEDRKDPASAHEVYQRGRPWVNGNLAGSSAISKQGRFFDHLSRQPHQALQGSALPLSYVEAVERFAGLAARESAHIAAHGKSQMLTSGSRTANAALLLHGMSASPMQFVDLAQQLHERGFNVFVPRLPRHGHHDRLSDELGALTADELREATIEAIALAQGLGEKLTVVGFSLGGLLSSWAAQFEPMYRAVSVAPFFGPPWMPAKIGEMIAMLTLKLPNRYHWWDPIKKEKQMPEHGYPRYSTHAVAQTYDLIGDLFRCAQQRAPAAQNIVMVTNYRETTVNNRTTGKLVQRWKKYKPDAVETYEFRDLPFSHDIIEPLRSPLIVAKVYPVLLKLIDREAE